MKAPTLNQIKKELETIAPDRVMSILLRLIKSKTENKELVSYILFDEADLSTYISDLRYEVEVQMTNLLKSPPYIQKRGLRKVLNYITRHAKYTGTKEAEVELLLFFCQQMNTLGLMRHPSRLIENIYVSQLNKINKKLPLVHEELQVDYQREWKALLKSL